MNWDNAWKEVLTHLFKEFLQFFFPRIYREVDFSRGYVFLNRVDENHQNRQRGRPDCR